MTALPADTEDHLGRDPDRPVAVHALVFLDEEAEVTVGRLDVDSYCVLPPDGAALLRRLQQGATPRDAGDWYRQAYGEPVDMAEFLAAMDELGFLVGSGPVAPPVTAVPWQRLGMLAFSRPAWLVYLAVVLAAAVAMARHPDLAPRPEHLLFTGYATGVLALAVFGQLPLVLLHEAFHALAGRRLGLHSRLRLGRRLYLLVAETTLDGLVVVPRRRRFLPILAGMLADLVAVAGLSLVAAALRHSDGGMPLAGRICLALAFLTVLRIVWQFYFFLQTDLYQLVVTVLGCVDLHRTTARWIVNRLHRALGRRHRVSDETLWHPRDRAAARWYCWVLAGGYLVSIGSFVLAVLPVLGRLFGDVRDRLTGGPGVGADALADSAAFLLLTVAQLALVAVLGLRERRERRARSTAHVLD
ncbi:hypothetical protein [Jatrophihabitans sp.]|uniref:hypothetical protein n=1 Tax=Jatrophihabitans sp. TaxID=1932789 RepID=UPI002C65204A|nr:hypothetical protein [Jatrophihabitans sp.]